MSNSRPKNEGPIDKFKKRLSGALRSSRGSDSSRGSENFEIKRAEEVAPAPTQDAPPIEPIKEASAPKRASEYGKINFPSDAADAADMKNPPPTPVNPDADAPGPMTGAAGTRARASDYGTIPTFKSDDNDSTPAAAIRPKLSRSSAVRANLSDSNNNRSMDLETSASSSVSSNASAPWEIAADNGLIKKPDYPVPQPPTGANAPNADTQKESVQARTPDFSNYGKLPSFKEPPAYAPVPLSPAEAAKAPGASVRARAAAFDEIRRKNELASTARNDGKSTGPAAEIKTTITTKDATAPTPTNPRRDKP